jgi:DNA-directed RNA polymerase alpha subunit
VFSSPGGALMAVPTWADALRDGQSVRVALGAVVVISIGVGAVHVNDHGQIEEDAVSTLLAVLQLRDIARRETGRLPVPPDAHTVSWHTVHLGCPIACLKLSKRPYNALHYKFRSNSEQATVANLLALNEQDLHDIRNLGPIGIEEITTKLATAGFRLGAHPGPRPE